MRHIPPNIRLSTRELEILGLVAEGLTSKQIGVALGSEVEVHIQSIVGKLGATNKVHAVVTAIRTGLVVL